MGFARAVFHAYASAERGAHLLYTGPFGSDWSGHAPGTVATFPNGASQFDADGEGWTEFGLSDQPAYAGGAVEQWCRDGSTGRLGGVGSGDLCSGPRGGGNALLLGWGGRRVADRAFVSRADSHWLTVVTEDARRSQVTGSRHGASAKVCVSGFPRGPKD